MVPALRFQDLAAIPLAHRLEGPIQAAEGRGGDEEEEEEEEEEEVGEGGRPTFP